eukprot:TRINITY_DN3983_c0_g2_i11.p1 TRINITY_DN3983_c0_g2~~TRINITY_DN3983_c0_g2_i11.p1  ORF type:complete len:423 (-),score=32.10 TRINITY_DN3983_c0_g2_i11:636-1904(-)
MFLEGFLSSIPKSRVAYCSIFLLTLIFLWIFERWLHLYIPTVFVDSFVLDTFGCGSRTECYQIASVRRISFGYTIFHLLIGLATIWKKKGYPYEWQLKLHDEMWMVKVPVFLIIMCISFLLIPSIFFDYWAYVEIVGGSFFLLIQAILVVDFAYVWYEMWASKNSYYYNVLLSSVAVLLFSVSIGLTSYSFAIFVPTTNDCKINIAILSETCAVCFIFTYISFHSRVERGTPMVSAFVTFWSVCLTGSAISGWQNSCQVNPPSGYDTFYTTVSCLFATVVIFYNSLHYLVAQQNPEVAVVTQTNYSGTSGVQMASVVTSLSGSHSSLSLLKPTRLSDIQMSYNLAQFHFTFAFGALYLGLIFAGWNLTNIPDPEKMGSIIFGIYFVVQVITALLYLWSLVSPLFSLPSKGEGQVSSSSSLSE